MAKKFNVVQVRPGVVQLRDSMNRTIAFLDFFCQDCGTREAKEMSYVVWSQLWDEFVPEDGILCLPCLCYRTGRLLQPLDFKPGMSPDRMRARDKFIRHAPCTCMVETLNSGPCRCRSALLNQRVEMDRRQDLQNPEMRLAALLDKTYDQLTHPTQDKG